MRDLHHIIIKLVYEPLMLFLEIDSWHIDHCRWVAVVWFTWSPTCSDGSHCLSHGSILFLRRLTKRTVNSSRICLIEWKKRCCSSFVKEGSRLAKNSSVKSFNPLSCKIKFQIPICCPYTFPIKIVERKLLKYQLIVSCVILSLILITNLFYKALISQAEFWY